MSATYEKDIVAWSKEQAALLRAGRLSALDLQHIADEVEDVGKSEQRELASRLAVLLAHLLKWSHQPERRGKSWAFTIREQRRALTLHLEGIPACGRLCGTPSGSRRFGPTHSPRPPRRRVLPISRRSARGRRRSSSTWTSFLPE